jgi:hypothetical protein
MAGSVLELKDQHRPALLRFRESLYFAAARSKFKTCDLILSDRSDLYACSVV